MSEIVMNLWLAFNIVFGLWSARNWTIRLWSFVINCKYLQSDMGRFLDLLVLVSLLAYYFSK